MRGAKSYEAIAHDDSYRLRARWSPFRRVREKMVGILAVLRCGLHMAAAAIVRCVLSVLLLAFKVRYFVGT